MARPRRDIAPRLLHAGTYVLRVDARYWAAGSLPFDLTVTSSP